LEGDRARAGRRGTEANDGGVRLDDGGQVHG
jgi:hypothetical protein